MSQLLGGRLPLLGVAPSRQLGFIAAANSLDPEPSEGTPMFLSPCAASLPPSLITYIANLLSEH